MAKAIGIVVITPKSLEKQVAFATAGALNDAAFAIRKQLVAALPESFTVRNKWTEKSLRVNKATRGQPVAEVGSIAAYMEDQVVGDTRTSGAVPTDKLRRNPRSIVRKSRWPGALLDDPRYFLADRRARRGPWAGARPGLRAVVMRGTGRRRRQRIMFFLPDAQRVEPRFPFREIAERVGEAEFNRALPVRLRAALESAR